jgi:hypothetical protein
MKWRRHLSDDRLLDCYLAERGLEPSDITANDHLSGCRACGRRYHELTDFMDDLRDQSIVETDAIFTADRLAAQQQEIALRLEQFGQAARVLAFPGPIAQPQTAGRRVAPRWLAAAAAAGLFVGVGVGIFLDAQARRTVAPAVASAAPARPAEKAAAPAATPVPAAAPVPESAPVVTPVNVSAPTDDELDELLSELLVAFERPATRELLALDAVTPHAHDNSVTPR